MRDQSSMEAIKKARRDHPADRGGKRKDRLG
jgi:hypothetical protein